MARLGVFLTPPAESAFYQVTSGILGYDIWAQERRASSLAGTVDDATLKRWLDFAPTFGIHCTIAGAALSYDDADTAEIEARLAWIAGRIAPFMLSNGRFFDDFRDAPKVLVATFDSPDGAIYRLHRLVVTMVSPLWVASGYASRVERFDHREREIYARVGEPYALDRFSPHWSLMTGTGDAASWTAARDLIVRRTGLFADASTRTLEVTDVQLVHRADDGFCTVVASYPLTGRS